MTFAHVVNAVVAKLHHLCLGKSAAAPIYAPAAKKSFSVGIQKVLIFKVELLRVPSLVNTRGQGTGTTGLVLDQISGQTLAFNTIAGSISRPSYSEKK